MATFAVQLLPADKQLSRIKFGTFAAPPEQIKVLKIERKCEAADSPD